MDSGCATTSRTIVLVWELGDVPWAGLTLSVAVGLEAGETTEIVLQRRSLKQPENC